MPVENFSVIILAAGMGKRMKNPDIPKVLAELNGKPLISYVLKEADELEPDEVVVIVGHHKEKVIDYIHSINFGPVTFIEQNRQLGTGHAVDQAEPLLRGYPGNILILAGDVPLLSAETLGRFITKHQQAGADISVLTTTAPDPTGYGRILRDSEGNFTGIVEHKDADEEQQKIDEINSGVYFVRSPLLFSSLKEVSNNNAQGEYYLTDIASILRDKGFSVHAFNVAGFDELQGINSPRDLERAEKILNTA